MPATNNVGSSRLSFHFGPGQSFSIRLESVDKYRLQGMAEKAGMSLSDYARAIVNAARGEKTIREAAEAAQSDTIGWLRMVILSSVRVTPLLEQLLRASSAVIEIERMSV